MNIPTLLSVLAATKRIPLLLAFLLPVLSSAAQNFDFAEQVFGFLQEGRGDSICARLAPQMAAAVTPETFGRAYAGLERSLGKMNRRGDWRHVPSARRSSDALSASFPDIEEEPHAFCPRFQRIGQRLPAQKTLSLHKIGCISAIKQAYCTQFALSLHKIGCISAIKQAYCTQFALSLHP